MQLEVIAQDTTLLRKSGNVHVVTITSKLMNIEIVKRNVGKQGKPKLPLKLMRDKESGLYILGVLLPTLKKTPFLDGVVEVSRHGRIISVERKEKT